MYSLSDKIVNLQPYEPLIGDYKIRLDVNESPYDLPKNIKNHIFEQFMETAVNRYPDPFAEGAVKSFADFYNLKTENIVAGNGLDEIIALIIGTFASDNDKICTLSNDFSMYKIYAKLYGKSVIEFKKNYDFTIDIDKLIYSCTNEKVKILIFSNPCNPTSLGIEKTEIIRLISALPDTLIILDEAYMDFWNQSLFGQYQPNLIILKTCSKAVGLAGLRMGFAISNEEIVKGLKAVKSPFNTNSFSQLATEIVMSEKKYLNEQIKIITENTAELYNSLKEDFNVLKSRTNFITLLNNKSEDIYKKLLKKSIAVRCFGDFLRITAGTPNENMILIKELKNAAS